MDYLFVKNVEAFRGKMASAKGVLRDIRDQLFRLADSPDPSPVREAPAFAYLLTGEEKYAQSYREVLMPQFKIINFDGCTEQEAHVAMGHQHIQSSHTTRAMTYYDWTADSAAYSEQEREWILKSFLDYVYCYPYPNGLRGGCNQSSANYLCVLVGGCLCGHRRGDELRGRRMYQYSLAAVRSLAGHVASGGYGGEGSTYQFSIHAPVIARVCDFYEMATGRTVFDTRYEPNNVSFRDILEVTLNEMTPAGNLLSWDNYGLCKASSVSTAAYMSRRGGGDRWLREMIGLQVPYVHNGLLWGDEDAIWTALWWPESLKELRRADLPPAKRRATSWMLPAVGAALEDRSAGVQLFQMWDYSTSAFVRWHGNPNSILFEAYESPLLNDGANGHGACPTFDHDNYFVADLAGVRAKSKAHGKLPADADKRGANCGQGTFDAHNVILVDIHRDENIGQRIDRETRGLGTLLRTSQFMDVVGADCTDYYPARFGITSITRTTTFVKPDYAVTRDHITSAEPHRFTYRLHLRPGVAVEGGRARLVTAEQVALNVVPLEEVEWERTECPGYPCLLEGRSDRLDLSRAGDDVEFTVLLAPEELKANKVDVSGGWRLADAAECDAMDPGADASRMPVVNAAYAWHFQGVAQGVRDAVLRRMLRIPALTHGERVYLRLGRPGPGGDAQGPSCELWVNGHRIEPLLPLGELPVRFDITEAITSGEEAFVAVRLCTDGCYGMAGRWALYTAGAPTLAHHISHVGEGIMAVECEAYRDILILEGDGKGVVDVEDWSTDASRGFLRSQDTWAVFDATHVRRGGQALMEALYPCTAGTKADCLSMDVREANSVDIRVPDLSLCVKNTSQVEVTCHWCRREKTMLLERLGDKMVFLNGRAVRCDGNGDTAEVRIPVTAPNEVDVNGLIGQLAHGDRSAKMDAILQLSYVHDRHEVVDALAAHLHDEDNGVRVHAIEALGRIRNENAVPVLMEAILSYYRRENAAVGVSMGLAQENRYRGAAMLSLMKHRDPRALPVLKECFELGNLHQGKKSLHYVLRRAIRWHEEGVHVLDRLDAVMNYTQNP